MDYYSTYATCAIESKRRYLLLLLESKQMIERSVFDSAVNDSIAPTIFVHIAAGGYICMCTGKEHNMMQHRSNTYILSLVLKHNILATMSASVLPYRNQTSGGFLALRRICLIKTEGLGLIHVIFCGSNYSIPI